MNILDDPTSWKDIDKGNILGSVQQLAKQCQHAWEQVSALELPADYQNIDNVVMCGMGGSGLGARVIESVYAGELKVPLVRVNSYNLPGFVNEKTLVFCSSYSGTTEETLENANQAIQNQAKWVAIATGDKLVDLAEAHHVPYFQIVPTHNPSNQPRMAIGYSIVGQLGMAKLAGIVQVSDEDIRALMVAMEGVVKLVGEGMSLANNPAKQIADKMKGKVIVYVGAEHLIGPLHTVNNQQNENAKNISMDVAIPELNHHLMEGLKHPQTNGANLLFIFTASDLYPPRIKRRMELTRQVVEKNGIETAEITLSSPTKLSQAFELIQFGGYLNFYLSMLYQQNPSPIPWVNWFKAELAK